MELLITIIFSIWGFYFGWNVDKITKNKILQFTLIITCCSVINQIYSKILTLL
jgi:hypothetical protein